METKIPKTKKECFALLDEMLSDEEKRTIIKEDVIELHFGLGMWIRNNWLYPQSDEDIEKLQRSFSSKDFMFYPPDEASSIILEAYQKHLRKILCPKRT